VFVPRRSEKFWTGFFQSMLLFKAAGLKGACRQTFTVAQRQRPYGGTVNPCQETQSRSPRRANSGAWRSQASAPVL
jgi:hypothetical protein